MLTMATKRNDYSIKSQYPWLREYYPVYMENGKLIVVNGQVGQGFPKRSDADAEGKRLQAEANARMEAKRAEIQAAKDKVMKEYLEAQTEAKAKMAESALAGGQSQSTDD